MHYSRIEQYIKAIDPIVQGSRNTSLYKVGISLRTKIGLVGNSLESALSETNQAKCIPPLSLDEVTAIARNVDKSDSPCGDKHRDHNGQRLQKSKTSQQRAEFYVSTQADSLPVADQLAKSISVYTDCHAKVPNCTLTIPVFWSDVSDKPRKHGVCGRTEDGRCTLLPRTWQ